MDTRKLFATLALAATVVAAGACSQTPADGGSLAPTGGTASPITGTPSPTGETASPTAETPSPTGGTPSPASVEVEMEDFSFRPAELTIAPGTTG